MNYPLITSIVVLAAASFALWKCLVRWEVALRASALSPALPSHFGRWAQLTVPFIDASIDSVLGAKTNFRRVFPASVLLLLLALSATGIATNTYCGLTEPPWSTYQKLVNMSSGASEKNLQNPNDKIRAMAEATLRFHQTLQAPAAKYIYSIVVTLFIVGINFVVVWLSLTLARFFLREFYAGVTTVQLIALVVFCGVALFIVAFGAFAFESLVTPLGWAPLLLIPLFHVTSPTAAVWLPMCGYALLWEMHSEWQVATLIAALTPMMAVVALSAPAATWGGLLLLIDRITPISSKRTAAAVVVLLLLLIYSMLRLLS